MALLLCRIMTQATQLFTFLHAFQFWTLKQKNLFLFLDCKINSPPGGSYFLFSLSDIYIHTVYIHLVSFLHLNWLNKHQRCLSVKPFLIN